MSEVAYLRPTTADAVDEDAIASIVGPDFMQRAADIMAQYPRSEVYAMSGLDWKGGARLVVGMSAIFLGAAASGAVILSPQVRSDWFASSELSGPTATPVPGTRVEARTATAAPAQPLVSKATPNQTKAQPAQPETCPSVIKPADLGSRLLRACIDKDVMVQGPLSLRPSGVYLNTDQTNIPGAPTIDVSVLGNSARRSVVCDPTVLHIGRSLDRATGGVVPAPKLKSGTSCHPA